MTKQMEEQVSLFDPDTASGKMFPALSQATAAKTFKPSSRSLSKSQSPTLPMCLCLTGGDGASQDYSMMRWENGAWPGGLTMRSTTVYRNGEKESVYWLTSTGFQQARFCLTLNMSERPRTANPSRLSDILETSPNEKYKLSAKACQGILNRAERRGKDLPAELKAALIAQANLPETDGLNQKEPTTTPEMTQDDPQFTLSAAHEHAVFSTSLNPWEIQQQRVQPRDGIAPTISAADKRYGAIQSLVLDDGVKAAGFSFGQSDKSRSIGYQEEMSPTLRGGDGGNQKPVVMCKNPQDPQSKRVFDPSGVGPTLNSGTTEGMNIVPSIMCGNPWDSQSERVYHGDGSWHSLNANESGGQSRDAVLAFSQNQREEVRELGDCAGSVSAETGTHQQTFVKAYSFDSMASNSMKSANPHSGCREVETSKTLDCFDPNPSKNQGGIAVLAVDCRNGVESEINGTLQAKDGGEYSLNLNNVIRTQNDSP